MRAVYRDTQGLSIPKRKSAHLRSRGGAIGVIAPGAYTGTRRKETARPHVLSFRRVRRATDAHGKAPFASQKQPSSQICSMAA